MAYHIKNDGTPGVCKAQPGNCPLAGVEGHFDTVEQAQEYAELINANKFGILGGESNKFDVGSDRLTKEEVETLPQVELEKMFDDVHQKMNAVNNATENELPKYPVRAATNNILYKDKLFNANHNLTLRTRSIMNKNQEITEWAQELSPELQRGVAAVLKRPSPSGRLDIITAPEVGGWSNYTKARTLVEEKFKYSNIEKEYNEYLSDKHRYEDLIATNNVQLFEHGAERERLTRNNRTHIDEIGNPKTILENKRALEQEMLSRKELKNLGLSDNHVVYKLDPDNELRGTIPANELAQTSFGHIANGYVVNRHGTADRIVKVEDSPIGQMFITGNGSHVQGAEDNRIRVFVDRNIKGNMDVLNVIDNGEFE